MTDTFRHMIRKAQENLKAEQERDILAHFGSMEGAIKFGKYFVIEETPIEVIYDEGKWGDTEIKVTFQTSVRIRQKTLEELTLEELEPLTPNVVRDIIRGSTRA